MDDENPSQACTKFDWTDERWEDVLKLVRGGGWLDGLQPRVVKSNTLMHVVLMLMVYGSLKGLEEHKDMRLELSRLLVSEDVEVELRKSRYWEFLKKFEGYNMGVCHQMAKSQEEGKVLVGYFSFVISPKIITKVSSLVEEGIKIT